MELRVFYGSRHGAEPGLDAEFGQEFAWDIPLLDGYDHEFAENGSPRAARHEGFFGIRIGDLDHKFKAFQADAVMILGWQLLCYWQAAFNARRLGIPYFVRGESNLLRRGGPLRWAIKRLTVGRLCRAASCCLAIGRKNAELFEAYGIERSKIRIAPYFVDNERFGNLSRSLMTKRNEIRDRFGLPRDSVVFLFAGKLIPKKHPEDLLRAYRSMSPQSRRCASLLFVGDGALRPALHHKVGDHPAIRFAGFLNQSRMPEAYAASDILVLPSDSGETWGLAVNEAMACGLPAIVSDQVGCAHDLVLEGQTGFVFPFGDHAALAHIMKRLIDHPGLISTLGKNANSHVQNYSIERAVDQVVGAMDAVGSRHSERSRS